MSLHPKFLELYGAIMDDAVPGNRFSFRHWLVRAGVIEVTQALQAEAAHNPRRPWPIENSRAFLWATAAQSVMHPKDVAAIIGSARNKAKDQANATGIAYGVYREPDACVPLDEFARKRLSARLGRRAPEGIACTGCEVRIKPAESGDIVIAETRDLYRQPGGQKLELPYEIEQGRLPGRQYVTNSIAGDIGLTVIADMLEAYHAHKTA